MAPCDPLTPGVCEPPGVDQSAAPAARFNYTTLASMGPSTSTSKQIHIPRANFLRIIVPSVEPDLIMEKRCPTYYASRYSPEHDFVRTQCPGSRDLIET